MTATLADVCDRLPDAEQQGPDIALTDVTHDSRAVEAGALFCAVVGAQSDGHDFAEQAVQDGASALLVERWLDVAVPQVKVPSVRAALGPAAALVHGDPSHELTVVGTTGTNGKTTVSYLLEAAFAAAGRGTGVIGTVETRIHGRAEPGVRTTPEGSDLQRQLRSMVTRGVDAVAMEVSSHGLDLHRVDGTRFAVAVWTNLTQDHLDWHGSLEAYFAAKARLFTPGLADCGVVFLDGEWANKLLAGTELDCLTVGREADADVRIGDERITVDGSSATLTGLDRVANAPAKVTINTPLLGGFNLANAAVAVVAAVVAGVEIDAAIAGVSASSGAPGRFERVEAGQDATVLVDYAHTPDAIHQVVDTIRAMLGQRRLILVLGCGGDRDRDKRAPMGAAAARADVAVLTSDNPRSEDPNRILAQMRAGADAAIDAGARTQLHVDVDRRRAIKFALGAAGADDVVVLAGKGHETTQELADRVVEFDDRVVVQELIEAGGGT